MKSHTVKCYQYLFNLLCNMQQSFHDEHAFYILINVCKFYPLNKYIYLLLVLLEYLMVYCLTR